MTALSITEFRDVVAEVGNRVAYSYERVMIRRHGKDLFALVSADDLALLEQLEDRTDVAAAKRARREKGSIPWDKAKKQLGW